MIQHTETMTWGASKAWQILTAWPTTPAPKTGWPVIYALEHRLFSDLTDLMRTAPVDDKTASAQQAVIVGITYADAAAAPVRRVQDYTPRLAAVGMPASEQPPGTGDADVLLAFLLNGLQPEIARRFDIDVNRQTLAGHSLGALFVLYTLFTHTCAFSFYLASSPSVWWGNRYLQRATEQFSRDRQRSYDPLLHRRSTPAHVAITVGEYEQSLSPAEYRREPEYQRQQLARRQSRRMVDDASHLSLQLSELPGLEVSFSVLAGQTHATAVTPALSTGVERVLSTFALANV